MREGEALTRKKQMRLMISRLFGYFMPSVLLEATAEEIRRGRLIIGFGILGAIFGTVYAAFYLAISHPWGAFIVLVCSSCFVMIPGYLRRTAQLARAGNLYCMVLTAGFFCLCWVEGGINGHALAWLVVSPLCAVLLVPRFDAWIWAGVTLLAAALVSGVELAGISPPIRYPHSWHSIVDMAGYVGLVAFMFMLGMIFEDGRHTAQQAIERAMAEVEHANARLLRLNDEKNEFLGIAAHDLKNPLTIVMGFSDLLKSGHIPAAQVTRVATNICKEAAKMRDLISNLLDLNAIEEGRTHLKPVPRLLSPILHEVAENHKTVAARKQISLTLQLHSNDLYAKCDCMALTQILDNLLSNAIKFSKPGSHVTTSVVTGGDHVTLNISDQGPGISEEDQKKLFQKFGKLSARPTGGESSNGLGLSIVKRLIEAMGGTIRCESRLGVGTSFIFTLPLAEPPALRVEHSETDRRWKGLPTAGDMRQDQEHHGSV